MKNLLFVFVGLLLFSCKDIKFKEPQPQGIEHLTTFPEALRGSFYADNNSDTLIVNPTSFVYGNKTSLVFAEGTISDTLVLKKWENTYFINIHENKLWNLVMVNVLDNGNLSLSILSIEKESDAANINAITPLETIYNTNKQIEYYIAQPNAAQLKQIIALHTSAENQILKRIKQ